jgi:transcription elongation GreA/GreB family factor
LSRAFVKEADGADGGELAELVVSPHRNLVTSEGLALIEATLQRLERELSVARRANERGAVARAERDLRYWRQRRISAELVPAPVGRSEVVRFGSRVTMRTEAGRVLRLRIVGEDEADPASGLISWVAPLAEQLLGARIGDAVPFQGGEAELLSIDDQSAG